MLARRIAAATTAVALAAPAAANAAPIVRHTSEGPSATPLIVELIAAAVIGVLFLSRRVIARGRAPPRTPSSSAAASIAVPPARLRRAPTQRASARVAAGHDDETTTPLMRTFLRA